MDQFTTQHTAATAGLDELLQHLYQDIDGYSLSSAGRERTNNFGEDFTYGDVTPEVVHQMLTGANVQPGEVFYDLGSGTGKAVILSALMFDLCSSIGIEYLEELYQGSQTALQRYKQDVLPHMDPYKELQEVHTMNASMTDTDFSDADIIFTHCTCFSPALMDNIIEKFSHLKRGTRIITASREMQADHLLYKGEEPCQMAWGAATLYYYEKK